MQHAVCSPSVVVAPSSRGASCSSRRAFFLQRRLGYGFHFRVEEVAQTALGPDQLRAARIGLDLAPQSQDLHIDTPIEHLAIVATNQLEKLFAGEDALRRTEEGHEQIVL